MLSNDEYHQCWSLPFAIAGGDSASAKQTQYADAASFIILTTNAAQVVVTTQFQYRENYYGFSWAVLTTQDYTDQGEKNWC
jgi:hypothetical protein